MESIVGARMARITLRGTDFGEGPGGIHCGDYKVQMKEVSTWADIHVVSWSDALIECNLPPWTFTDDQPHRLRVMTPTGISNEREFYLLPAPTVGRIEDNTGKDAQGPMSGWVTVYSQGSPGTFSDAREKWYEDSLGGTCPNHYGTIYVVSLTSSSFQYYAKAYRKWNVTGNKDSFKFRLWNLWQDTDGDYYQDSDEQIPHPVFVGPYSVQVCLIVYADTDSSGGYSGNDDTVHQVVKSKSEIVYEINTDPIITKLNPNTLEPKDILVIRGRNFSNNPSGADVVRIGGRSFNHTHRRVKLWTNTKIRIRVPNYTCEAFGQNSSITKKVRVTVSGVDSNVKRLKVMRPHACDEPTGCTACH
jgi:hypothetical protein